MVNPLKYQSQMEISVEGAVEQTSVDKVTVKINKCQEQVIVTQKLKKD